MEQRSGQYPQLPPRPSDTELVAQYSQDLGGFKQAIETNLRELHNSLANRFTGLSEDLKTLTSAVKQNQGRDSQGKLPRLRDYLWSFDNRLWMILGRFTTPSTSTRSSNPEQQVEQTLNELLIKINELNAEKDVMSQENGRCQKKIEELEKSCWELDANRRKLQ
ncbi:hypothetical protein MMC17_000764 [Xylographa soralifera]|nr:hypothetical protein [Xylographa soralifera]